MQLCIENITVKKAENYLNSNTCNRKLREGLVEKYAADMKDGRWTECPEPISFYADGSICDGQHRLYAIVESGVAIKFAVARGLSRAAGLNINTGTARNLIDNAKISGIDTDLTNEMLSVARAMEHGERQIGRPRSNAERLDDVAKHKEASKWACTNGPRGRFLRNSCVLAAIGRAAYHESDRDRLKRFCEVVTTGIYDDATEDAAALTLRNYLHNKGQLLNSPGLWRDTFLKVQNTVSYFMKRKPLAIIKHVKDEAYPLPKVAQRKAA